MGTWSLIVWVWCIFTPLRLPSIVLHRLEVSISQKSELLIDGNVTLNDLDLDGALRLLADGELGSKVVKSLDTSRS